MQKEFLILSGMYIPNKLSGFFFFFLNFRLLLPAGKAIIMSSLGSGQLDFFDLDFFPFIKALSCFSLYLGGVRLWRDFQTALSVMPWWTWGWGSGCKKWVTLWDSPCSSPFVLFLYNLLKNEHDHFMFLPQILSCVCICVCTDVCRG